MKLHALLRHLSLALCLSFLTLAPAHAQDVRQALEALKQEPTIEEVLKAALTQSGLDYEHTESLRSRASWKAALPNLGIRARRSSQDMDVTKWDEGSDQTTLDNAVGSSLDLEASAQWNLPNLVYNAEVLDLANAQTLARELVDNVSNLYYQRRRLQIEKILEPPRDIRSELSQELRLEELTAKLDTLTGGLFARYATRNNNRRANQRGGNR